MSATADDLSRWAAQARIDGHQFFLVVWDSFESDPDDDGLYPVYAKDRDDLRVQFKRYDGKDMQRVEEVYEVLFNVAVKTLAHYQRPEDDIPPPNAVVSSRTGQYLKDKSGRYIVRQSTVEDSGESPPTE
jgi:hypothetical protein